MNKLLTCRRTFLATLSMTYLLVLGLVHNADVAVHLATIAAAVAAANAWEKKGKNQE